MKPHRLILCNDGGTLVAPTMEAPIGAEGLARLAIDPLRDTQVDTLFWQLGTDPYLGTPTHRLSDHYSHDTAVGPRWGQDGSPFTTASNWRIYENARQMSESGADPAAVVIEHGHQAGLEVFLSMRVNDVHDLRLAGWAGRPADVAHETGPSGLAPRTGCARARGRSALRRGPTAGQDGLRLRGAGIAGLQAGPGPGGHRQIRPGWT